MATDPKEVGVSVSIPQNVQIKVHDLKAQPLTPQQLEELIKKASASKVGFVILNAPFKLRSAGPAS